MKIKTLFKFGNLGELNYHNMPMFCYGFGISVNYYRPDSYTGASISLRLEVINKEHVFYLTKFKNMKEGEEV